MSKKKTYFSILIAILAIVLVGYLFNIGQIKSLVSSCIAFAGNNMLSTAAAVCAFIFLGNKNYWMIMLGCAAGTAVILQLIKMSGLGLMTSFAMILTFLSIVFVMNFMKLLINK